MDGQQFKRNLLGFSGGILAALIVVKGIIAIVPDAILLDRYGDVRGIFQIALAVVAITIFGASWHWLDSKE